MSRFSTGSIPIGTTLGTSRNPNTDTVINDAVAFDGSAASSAEAIKDRVKGSSIYRAVFSVFSAELDKYWLTQLTGIVDSIVGATETFWDDHGFSSASSDKNEAIYNEAINNIQALYNQYQSYKNSLPKTQVQQFADAGINAAITGNGVTGSTLGENPFQTGSASLPSTNSGEYLSQVANFALSATSGITSTLKSVADTVLAFRGQGLQRDAQQLSREQFEQTKFESFARFKAEMASKGVMLSSSSWDELNEKDPTWNQSSGAKANKLYNDWLLLDNTYKYGPELSAFGSVDKDLQDDFQDIGYMQLGLRLAEINHHSARRSKQMPLELTEDGLKEFELHQRKADAEFNAEKASIFCERLRSLADKSSNGNVVAQVELINMMQNADWQESLIYLLGENVDFSAIGDTVDSIVSSLESVASFFEKDNTADAPSNPIIDTHPLLYPIKGIKKLIKSLKDRRK